MEYACWGEVMFPNGCVGGGGLGCGECRTTLSLCKLGKINSSRVAK
jgi:hypothetical protein